MQQHSAQHLLTSIAADFEEVAKRNAEDPCVAAALASVEHRLCFSHAHISNHHPQTTTPTQTAHSFETVGWELGTERCVVEFALAEGAGAPTGPELALLEAVANAAVRQHRAVAATEHSDRTTLPAALRSRGDVPAGSAIRVVAIDGYDTATCCGTHVRNTADLQAVKLVGTEHGRSGTVRVLFLAGARVLAALGAGLERDRALGRCFGCPPADFVRRVEGLFETTAALTRAKKQLTAALVERDAARLVADAAHPAPVADVPDAHLYTSHCGGAAMDYLEQLVEQLAAHSDAFPSNSLLLLTVSNDPKPTGPGCFLITLLNGTEQSCLFCSFTLFCCFVHIFFLLPFKQMSRRLQKRSRLCSRAKVAARAALSRARPPRWNISPNSLLLFLLLNELFLFHPSSKNHHHHQHHSE